MEDSSQREEIGVSPSLLSRLRNGLKPDTDSFATIVRWLGIPAERFFVGEHKKRLIHMMTMIL